MARGKGSLIRAGPSYPQRLRVRPLLTCVIYTRTVPGFVDEHYLFVFSLFLERLRSHGHEENLSTEQTASQAQPRVPSPHGHSRGTRRAEASPGEGPRAPDALIFFSHSALVPDSAGFPPQKRLRASHDYSRVFADPVRSTDRFFTVLARRNELGTPRLGLAISRKAAKRAVDRNRLKRIARESFRQQRLPAVDFVVLARAGASAAAPPELRQSLDSHFVKLARRAEQRPRR